MPRITVAQLAEQVATQGEALNAILAMLTEQAPAPEPSAPETTAASASPFTPIASGDAMQPSAAPSDNFEDVVLVVERQAERSAAGKLRFWTGDEGTGSASVYIGGADDLAAKQLTLTLTSVEQGQASLEVKKAASGRRRVSKGRHSWQGHFAYGDATIGVFVSIPTATAKQMPNEIGFTLDGLS